MFVHSQFNIKNMLWLLISIASKELELNLTSTGTYKIFFPYRNTIKFLNFWTAAIYLKFKQRGQTLGYLYPRHLCRRVYSFRLSVCPFVRSYVRSFVRSWNLRQSFALKFLMWCISQQLLIRKHSYLDHNYPGGLAFTP